MAKISADAADSASWVMRLLSSTGLHPQSGPCVVGGCWELCGPPPPRTPAAPSPRVHVTLCCFPAARSAAETPTAGDQVVPLPQLLQGRCDHRPQKPSWNRKQRGPGRQGNDETWGSHLVALGSHFLQNEGIKGDGSPDFFQFSNSMLFFSYIFFLHLGHFVHSPTCFGCHWKHVS